MEELVVLIVTPLAVKETLFRDELQPPSLDLDRSFAWSFTWLGWFFIGIDDRAF